MPVQRAPKAQLNFIQWLRVFLIALVVAHHAGAPYGPTAIAWPVDDPSNSDLLLPFFAVNAAFFMGLFFLISGYFIVGSYDRHGARKYLISRLLRLGLPLFVIVILYNGYIAFADSATTGGYLGYLWNDYIGGRMDFGPLWFIAHLLVYAGLYALFRMIVPRRQPRTEPPVPGHVSIAIYTFALTVVTYFLRQIWPQDVWVRFLWFIPLEPMHLPQYASLFMIGIIASRGDWFLHIPKRVGYIWFWIAVAVFAVAAGLATLGVDLPGNWDATDFWRLIDSVICVGMILGLLVFFREHADRTGPIAKRLAASVYGIYLIHIYVVIGLQAALVETTLGALTKFLIVTVAGFSLSFLIVDTLRRVKVVRNII